MTKQEYQVITLLLKEQEYYEEVLRGFKEGARHYVVSKHCVGDEEINSYIMDSADEEIFIKYFEKKLKNINEELKELGYYD